MHGNARSILNGISFRAFALKVCLSTLALCVCTPSSLAQKRAMNWYFGSNAGVGFQTGEAVALTDGQLNTTEGCASISSPTTGDLLFYTDGMTVWNRLHEPMPNGAGLNGDESTSQSALIIPHPNNNYTYLIVTPAPITSSHINGRCFCLTYSIVDMRREDFYGDVVVRNEMLEDDITEHVAAAPDCEGGGWWIIARKRSTSTFVAYHLTTEGVSSTPVVSHMGNNYEVRDAGQLQSSPDGMHLILTSASGLSLLYNFERTTGVVYNQVDLFNGVKVGTHYGATFTQDDKYVYTAVTTSAPNEGTSLYRWDITKPSSLDIILSREQVGWLPGINSWTPMQLGPDAKIYVGKPGQNSLARFNAPSTPDPMFEESAITLAGVCRSGLPNFPGALMLPFRPGDALCRVPIASIADTTVCANECVRFRDESKGNITLRTWTSLGSVPTTSAEYSPRFCFSKPGTWAVRLIVTNDFGSDTTFANIIVRPAPALTTRPDVAICKGSSIHLNGSGADQYKWQPVTGLSNPNIANPIAAPTVTTRYTVVGTSEYGCKDTAFVLVTVKEPKAGADQSICSGGSVVLTASGADSYMWFPASSLSDPRSPTPTASPSITTTYVVRMQVDSCVVFDSVTVNVVDNVVVDLVSPPQTCRGEVITLRAVGNATEYTWFGEGIVQSDGDSAVISKNQSGRIIVVGKIGTCVSSDSVFINVLPTPTLSVSPDAALCLGSGVDLSATSDVTDIQWSPADGLNTTTGPIVRASPTATTKYTVTATHQSGCSVNATVTVSVFTSGAIDAGANKEICKGQSVRISATGFAETYRWEPTTGLSDPNALSPIAQPLTTTVYTLRASTGDCEGIDSMTVFVSSVDVAVTGETSICFGSNTELLATGAASYRWDPADGLSDPTIANPIATPRVTTTYEVTGIDVLGCVDKERITIRVIDTTSIRLKVGTVTADAGTSDFGIPVFVEVNPRLLPMLIPKLTATLISDASVFIPTDIDRGLFLTGITNGIRRTIIDLEQILVVSAHQKITEIRSTVLLGKEFVGELSWEDVTWTGVVCPSPVSIPGRLYVSGCSLQNRVLVLYHATKIDVGVQPSSDVINVRLTGGEPGTFVMRLISVDGRVIDEQSVTRPLDSDTEHMWHVNMSAFSSGLYSLVVDSPTQRHVSRIAWLP